MQEKLLDYLNFFRKAQISKIFQSYSSLAVDVIKSKYIDSDSKEYFKNYNPDGVPFTDFELEPDSISQLKKLMVAAYYFKLAFIDLENLELCDTNKTYIEIVCDCRQTVHYAFLACQALTHLDVDLQLIFSEEIKLLAPLMEQFWEQAKNNNQDLTQKLTTNPISYNAGTVTGIAVTQLQPDGDDLDYSFLTQFGGLLPGYIQLATQKLQIFSSQLIEDENTLNPEKLEEYRNLALSLLNNLEDLKGTDLFVSVKLLQYIKIINQTITLSATILDQIGELGQTSQDGIRAKLTQLKLELLPELFGLVDKIECNSMVDSGVSSELLMQQIKSIYNFLIYYARKVVNFEKKGEELLTLDCPRFQSLRLQHSYRRIDDANKILFYNQQAKHACTQFYDILEQLEDQNIRIHELPDAVKEELTLHYKILKPYMFKVDVDVASILVYSLKGVETWESWFFTPWRTYNKTPASDQLEVVKRCKQPLINLIIKEEKSQNHHILLTEKLIAYVKNNTDLAILRYDAQVNIYATDETLAFAQPMPEALTFVTDDLGNKYLSNPELLTVEQALNLNQMYRNKLNHLQTARTAYDDFHKLTRGNPLMLLYQERSLACNLYKIFQPYFVSAAPLDQKDAVINCDIYLTQMFAIKKFTAATPSEYFMGNLQDHYQSHFNQVALSWRNQENKYVQIAKLKFANDNANAPLENIIDPEDRNNYLIKHKIYSRTIQNFNKSVRELLQQYNSAMQISLKPNLFWRPYPEMEDYVQSLAQPSQVKAIKQIYNNLYHIEQIILNLENIYDRPYLWEPTTVIYEWNSSVQYIVWAYLHLHPIIKTAKTLMNDPHLGFIGSEIIDKARAALGLLQEHTYAYQVPAPESPPEPIRYNPLWYVLNAFYISPIHIRAIRNHNYISSDELSDLHEQAKLANINIEKIIISSGSYLKLFLQTPNMLHLYRSLKHKLNEFTNSAHDAVLHNLEKIKSGIFSEIILEADKWEAEAGLQLGLISGPMEQILDEYYKGLLEPLGLKSQRHLELVFNNSITEQRLLRVHHIQEKTSSRINNKQGKYAEMIGFCNFIILKKPILTNLKPDQWEEEFKTQLIALYTPCIYRLAKLNKKLQISDRFTNEYAYIDEFLNATTNTYDPKLTNIITTAEAALSYYNGKQNTLSMTRATALEQQNYLNKLNQNKPYEDNTFRDEYTQKSFVRELEAVCNRHIGFQYMDKEYSSNLKDYLLQHENKIIAKSKSAPDIDRSIQNMLHRYAAGFEREHYAGYYHLESVRFALAQFKNYLNEATADVNSIHEDEETLRAKSDRIKVVDDIATNANLSIDVRFRRIKQKVIIDASFKRVLCAQKQVQPFSWAYLQQCFISLLEAIHLYTSERKRYCNNIINSVNNKPELNTLINRFGLFSGKPLRANSNFKAINLPEPNFRV